MTNAFGDELEPIQIGGVNVADPGSAADADFRKTWARLYGRLDVPYAAIIAIDFDNEEARMIAPLTGDLELTTANLAPGRELEVVIRGGASGGNLTFPGWIPEGGALPTGIAAGKTGTLKLRSEGTTDADVRANWSVEP
jgi:hypothetical protein